MNCEGWLVEDSERGKYGVGKGGEGFRVLGSK